MPTERNGPFKFWKDAAFVQICKVEAWLLHKMASGSIFKAKRAMLAYYLHLNLLMKMSLKMKGNFTSEANCDVLDSIIYSLFTALDFNGYFSRHR